MALKWPDTFKLQEFISVKDTDFRSGSLLSDKAGSHLNHCEVIICTKRFSTHFRAVSIKQKCTKPPELAVKTEASGQNPPINPPITPLPTQLTQRSQTPKPRRCPDPSSSEHLPNMTKQQEVAKSCCSLTLTQFNLSLLHQKFFPCNFITGLSLCEENPSTPV